MCSTVHGWREDTSGRTDEWKPHGVGRKEKGVKMLAASCMLVCVAESEMTAIHY